ncbi:LINE-1 retrotransposable element ORF2 protein [Merluccius polli]|uniref:LINE-1 retrotransposable element ORF2 protein n=1 Tax=Merluccius polli TaxID=89951 RepID=A0AA47MVT2_MERPO|nr:LINE-1 retrotransposable element ORF2 protein [Merluccius polli]
MATAEAEGMWEERGVHVPDGKDGVTVGVGRAAHHTVGDVLLNGLKRFKTGFFRDRKYPKSAQGEEVWTEMFRRSRSKVLVDYASEEEDDMSWHYEHCYKHYSTSVGIMSGSPWPLAGVLEDSHPGNQGLWPLALNHSPVGPSLWAPAINIKGSAENKLEKMGDFIYNYGEEKCGVKDQVRKKNIRKLWRKATAEEREGINLLQENLKHRLSKLRRAESLRMRRKKKKKARTDFYKDPFKFVKGIFTKEKSGSLKTSKDQVEEHLRTIYTDEKNYEPIVVPTDIPPISPPQHQFDISPPKLSEVKQAVKKERSASAPGPNGVAWDKQIIPKAWRRAGGVLIPKEKNSTTIEQFRHINLLNIEGKIFFSVLAQRLTQYLKQNHFIETSIQKAGIIWHQIQTAKKEGKDLHVLFLDLANAYGSVPHSLLWAAFDFFQVPTTITNLVKHYFQDLQFCLTTSGFTTSWQPLEVGIMAGCTISPLAFTMAMEIIIRASKWVVGGERL